MSFFIPITYGTQNKTRPERALELVDEYFYLGGKYHITIFDPDENHPGLYATKNSQSSNRSCMNISIKVASYCTIILPLIALSIKAPLRSYLRISSIKVQESLLSNQRTDVLTSISSIKVQESLLSNQRTDVLTSISSFLDKEELKIFAETARFAHDGVGDYKKIIVNHYKSLIREIQNLEQSHDRKAKELFTKLIAISSRLYIKDYYIKALDALVQRLMPLPNNTINSLIEGHAKIAGLLASNGIASSRVNDFLQYLKKNKLVSLDPWIGVRVLEQYLLQSQLDSEAIETVLKGYLAEKLKHESPVRLGDLSTCEEKDQIRRRALVIRISCETWFGPNSEDLSLWKQPRNQGDDSAFTTQRLLELLSEEIVTFKNIDKEEWQEEELGCGIEVSRSENSNPPSNFTGWLIIRLTHQGIFPAESD